MGNWTKTFTQIENVNSGREVELNDVPTPEMFNVALNNTQWLYNLFTNGFVKSITGNANGLTITYKNSAGTESTATITQDDLGLYKKADIDGFVAGVVKYTAQSLTDAQKTQARANIGAGDGDYNNLQHRLYVHHIYVRLNANQSTASQSASAFIREGRIGDTAVFTIVNRSFANYGGQDTSSLFSAIQDNGGLISTTGFVQDGEGNKYPLMYVNKIAGNSFLEFVAIDGRKFSVYTEPTSQFSNGYVVTDTVV